MFYDVPPSPRPNHQKISITTTSSARHRPPFFHSLERKYRWGGEGFTAANSALTCCAIARKARPTPEGCSPLCAPAAFPLSIAGLLPAHYASHPPVLKSRFSLIKGVIAIETDSYLRLQINELCDRTICVSENVSFCSH